MTRAVSKPPSAQPPSVKAGKQMPEGGFEPEEAEEEDDPDAPDELADETGLDLTDASELDADNVLADEEFDRVMQAPD
ncbi:hypothetical protein QTI66_15630 [Variovorax sp. J22R133]|uniref:hypothetical protein n=1 Tax=Variovorax brevis TaxID=3053503 RepID=UPI00257732A5|nr:hypothetical protein [Variovorax sp. J22R133]MDM0113590.1 hypothetical protein [Variovorax sp. J22R133]